MLSTFNVQPGVVARRGVLDKTVVSRNFVQPTRQNTSVDRGDEVRFGSTFRQNLLQRYGISPEQVKVVASSGITVKNKEMLIHRGLEAHEAALKYKLVGNFSGRYRCTNIQLANGSWNTGVNIEVSRECTLCGERSALIAAENKTLKSANLEQLTSTATGRDGKTSLERLKEGMKVKTLVLASDVLGEQYEICSDCESWMSQASYFSPDTLLVSLVRKSEEEGKTPSFVLQVQALRERLPFLGKQQPSLASLPIERLPISFSDSARGAMRLKNISAQQLVGLLSQTQAQHLASPSALFSKKNQAAGVLFTTGQVQTASRVDITKRWFVSPDLMAMAKGVSVQPLTGFKKLVHRLVEFTFYPFQMIYKGMQWLVAKLFSQHTETHTNVGSEGYNRVEAIAYYGEDSNTPPSDTLGKLAQPSRGGLDTLIVVIENDTIQVRTIKDYRPYTRISEHTKGS